MDLNPGLTRKYWKMRCLATGGISSTDVAPENSLEPPKNGASELDAPEQLTQDQINREIVESITQQEQSQDGNGDNEALGADSEGGNPVSSQVLGTPGNIELSGEQKAVLYLVLNSKHNVFFTGAAGTGKSVLLRHLIARLREKHNFNEVAVTALTGIAACNIGGQTLHRFAGVGLARDDVRSLIDRIKRSEATYNRWLTTKYLIIDEVSMLPCELLEKLEQIARFIRNNDEPFGGIQLIFTGDLFQLPPVDTANNEAKYCFESDTWRRCINRTINLTEIFRQSDPKFTNILNQLRLGQVSPEARELFMKMSRPPKVPKGIVATRLYCTRDEVNRANSQALERLHGPVYSYSCADGGLSDAEKRANPDIRYLDLDKQVIAEREVHLKVGAQVMLIKNLDNTLVNGSIGRVVAFVTQDTLKNVDYGNNSSKNPGGGLIDPGEPGNKEKDPAAGTITSHFRSRKLDLENATEEQNRENLNKLLGAYGNSPAAIRKRRFAETLTQKEAKKKPVLPVVRFPLPDGTKRLVIIRPETWELTNSDGELLASRTQMPLLLAWALSIHKSQGQTLPYLSVDLGRIFAKGQAYVAISRATSLDSLQIMNFRQSRINADERVVKFYKQLGKISEADLRVAESHHKMDILMREAALNKKRKEAEAREKAKEDIKVENSYETEESSQADAASQTRAEMAAVEAAEIAAAEADEANENSARASQLPSSYAASASTSASANEPATASASKRRRLIGADLDAAMSKELEEKMTKKTEVLRVRRQRQRELQEALEKERELLEDEMRAMDELEEEQRLLTSYPSMIEEEEPLQPLRSSNAPQPTQQPTQPTQPVGRKAPNVITSSFSFHDSVPDSEDDMFDDDSDYLDANFVNVLKSPRRSSQHPQVVGAEARRR